MYIPLVSFSVVTSDFGVTAFSSTTVGDMVDDEAVFIADVDIVVRTSVHV